MNVSTTRLVIKTVTIQMEAIHVAVMKVTSWHPMDGDAKVRYLAILATPLQDTRKLHTLFTKIEFSLEYTMLLNRYCHFLLYRYK